MKYAFTIALLLFSVLAKSQPTGTVDSVSIYIEKLGWNSFTIIWNYDSQVSLCGNDYRTDLIAINDDGKIKKLINNIGVKEKTVIIHMILSHLFDSTNARVAGLYNYEKDSTIKSVDFTYNGLQWTEDAHQKNNSISQEEIDRVERYWRERCHLY